MTSFFRRSDLNALFRIRERTRNEFLTAAPDGRVVRWCEEDQTTRASQQWYISEYKIRDAAGNLSEIRYRLQNVATNGFLHVGFQGGLGWYWASVDDEHETDSTFTFELTHFQKEASFGAGPFPYWLLIREHSHNEFVSVGDNGWLIRWSRTGGNGQQFYLEKFYDLSVLPTAELPQQTVNQIPPVPDLTSINEIPKPGPRYLVGEEVIPSAFVRDQRFSSPLAQVFSSAWYVLKHYQNYDLPDEGQPSSMTFTGYEEVIHEVTMRTRFTKADLTSIQDAFTWNISGEASVTIKGTGKDPSTGATAEGSGSSKLAFSVTKSLTQLSQKTETYEQEAIVRHSVKYPAAGTQFLAVTYGLRDTYELHDSSGNIIHSWTLWDDGQVINRSFPKLEKNSVPVQALSPV